MTEKIARQTRRALGRSSPVPSSEPEIVEKYVGETFAQASERVAEERAARVPSSAPEDFERLLDALFDAGPNIDGVPLREWMSDPESSRIQQTGLTAEEADLAMRGGINDALRRKLSAIIGVAALRSLEGEGK